MRAQQAGHRGVTGCVIDGLTFAMMDDLTALTTAADASGATTNQRVADAFGRHQRELFTFALRASRDRGIAEDLVQEAFLRLIVEIDAGRAPDNERAWLFRVTANMNVSRGRRASTAQRQAGELVELGVQAGPEAQYLDHERRSDMDAALAGLSSDARTALLMAANGFKGVEIADAIGRSALATRTMMCRARLQLRERLGSSEATA
jgi:RNA polymerase sigma-70 factor (ECF subfamily)